MSNTPIQTVINITNKMLDPNQLNAFSQKGITIIQDERFLNSSTIDKLIKMDIKGDCHLLRVGLLIDTPEQVFKFKHYFPLLEQGLFLEEDYVLYEEGEPENPITQCDHFFPVEKVVMNLTYAPIDRYIKEVAYRKHNFQVYERRALYGCSNIDKIKNELSRDFILDTMGILINTAEQAIKLKDHFDIFDLNRYDTGKTFYWPKSK